MKTLQVLFPGLCLAVVIAAGCSKNKSRTRTPVTHKVVISGMKFHPATLTVAKGDTVIWINKDIVTHNVTAYPDSEWTSGPMAKGVSWKKVANKSFKYFCSIHPAMKGKIKVAKGK